MSSRRTFLKSVLAGGVAVATGILSKESKSTSAPILEYWPPLEPDFPDDPTIEEIGKRMSYSFKQATDCMVVDVFAPLHVISVYRFIKVKRRTDEMATKFHTPISMLTLSIAEFNEGTYFTKRSFKNMRNCGIHHGEKKYISFLPLGLGHGQLSRFFVNGEILKSGQIFPTSPAPFMEYQYRNDWRKKVFDLNSIGFNPIDLPPIVCLLPPPNYPKT